jgi:transcription elongation GreA/GreB family factor
VSLDRVADRARGALALPFVATSPWLDKHVLLRALVEALERDLAKAVQAQRLTQSGATHEESKPENDKDTRALESSYLARGQAKRVLELRDELASVKLMEARAFDPSTPIALSAVVELGSDEGNVIYWLVPGGAGARLDVGEHSVRIVTPQSPLGRSLLGKRLGDTFDVRTPTGLHEYEVVRVC